MAANIMSINPSRIRAFRNVHENPKQRPLKDPWFSLRAHWQHPSILAFFNSILIPWSFTLCLRRQAVKEQV